MKKLFLCIVVFYLFNLSCKKSDNPVSSAEDLPRPSNLVATPISPSQVELTWDDNTINETGFIVERSKGSLERLEATETVGRNFTLFRMTLLEPDTEYFFRVRAVYDNIESFYSNEATARTPTNDGAWVESVTGLEFSFHGVQMLNASTIIAVGDRGTVLRTEDFGVTWDKPFSQTEERLLDISFHDYNIGMISSATFSGSFSFVLQTSLAGQQWLVRDILLQENLNAIEFINAQTAIVVGDAGTIAKTTDDGNSWQKTNSPTANDLLSVDFATEQVGFIIGRGSTLLHSDDGGSTWNSQPLNVDIELWDIVFSDSMNGCIVGENATILKSNDGGLSWVTHVTGLSKTLYSVTFVSPDSGFAVGQDGIILQTTDGGSNWLPQKSTTKNALFDIHFFDAEHGAATGEYGTILLTSVGGKLPD